MRSIIFAVALTLAAACLPADQAPQNAASAPEKVEVRDGRVTLALTNAPVVEAVEKLFRAAGKAYTVRPTAAMLMGSETEWLRANVHVNNLPFDQALRLLLQSAGLEYVVDNDIYVIMTAEQYAEECRHGPSAPFPGPLHSPPGSLPVSTYPINVTPHDVTTVLQAMPVAQAYEAVTKASGVPDFLGWRFKDNLGETTMPGAKFFAFPPEAAAAIVVAAAGLVPPPPGETLITRKGRSDFSELDQYGWSSVTLPGAGLPSIASYKAPDNEWRYFVRADLTSATALARLLISDRGDYIIEEPGSTGAGGESSTPMPRLSVRLTNVTLDQALRSILIPAGYLYQVENGVYKIRHR